MKLYLVDGEDMKHRVGPYQTLIVLAKDPAAVREVVERERNGFRIDRIDFVREYPQLKGSRHALVARITSPTPMLYLIKGRTHAAIHDCPDKSRE